MLAAGISIDERALAALCNKYGVAKLSLFGSVLRDDYDPDRSDIDVLVEFQPNASKSLFKLLRF
jgi:predicted nucleotidyltransferase